MQVDKYNWDLSKFCESVADCEARISNIEGGIEELMSYKGKLGDPKLLLEYWQKSNVIGTEYERCLIYAYAGQDVDYNNQELSRLCMLVRELGVKLSTATAWENPELKGLGNDYLAKLKDMDEYKNWRLYIDNVMYDNQHTLSEPEEQIMASIGKFTDSFKEIFQACYMGDIKYQDAEDSEGKKHKINTGNASSFMLNADRVLRKNASESISEAYKTYGNTIAQNLIHYFIKNVTLSKIRKYNSVLDKYLGRYQLKRDIYDNVINFANKNLDIHTRYYQNKKKLLGLDVMYNYDMRAPILSNTHEYTFEEGIDIIKEALKPLGEEYVAMIDRAVNERWVDVYPKDGKADGGYCWGTYGITHIILMNWTGKLNDVFTLAHELGHAIQHYYNYKYQEKQNTDLPIFIAETASTFNEILVYDYLLKQAKTDEEKIEILDSQMADINGVIFVQTNMSQFEDYCYTTIENGGALTLENMQEKWKEYTQKHLREVITYTSDKPLNWENIWHFYNASYYVWQYAMAYLISSKLANDVLQNNPQAIDNYMQFLRYTSEYDVYTFLKNLGVDIYDEEFYKSSFDVYQKISIN
ncbi:MAG: oligoendopeptidase F family protein, partial [Clostridia bacterium]|nr:oligoendopeptidase F family protein [Clostridia bacterium]